jgi:hypothetical protein
MGLSLEKIFVCRFNQKECENNNDFHWFYSYENGNCWQFNSGFNLTEHKVPIQKSMTESKDNGLYIMVIGLANNNKYPSINSKGLTIFVHNQSFSPSQSEAVYL